MKMLQEFPISHNHNYVAGVFIKSDYSDNIVTISKKIELLVVILRVCRT